MPVDPHEPIGVSYTPEFKRNLRHLAKKYRHMHADIQPILDDLAEGAKPGDQISGLQVEAFKVRVRNSDARKGKSGGFRIIYHVKSAREIILVTIYSKSEQADVTAKEIRGIIASQEASEVVNKVDEKESDRPLTE